MKHPLFHTLIVSSLASLEGCALSHGEGLATLDAGPADAHPTQDSRILDEGPGSLDAGVLEDSGVDTSAFEDSGVPETGSPVDAPPLEDPRMCEPGWPPTKGLRVCQVHDDEGRALIRCVYGAPVDRETGEVDWPSVDWDSGDSEPASLEIRDGSSFVTHSTEDECHVEGTLLVCGDEACELSDDLLMGTRGL